MPYHHHDSQAAADFRQSQWDQLVHSQTFPLSIMETIPSKEGEKTEEKAGTTAQPVLGEDTETTEKP